MIGPRAWAPLVVAVALAWSASADIKVTPLVTDGHVSASIDAPDAFTEDSREVIKSGVPLTLTYRVELRRPAMLFDSTVGSATVAARVKFDSLTGAYLVTKEQDGRVTSAQNTPKEEEMRAWITRFDGVAVQASEALVPNTEYYLHVRLQIRPNPKFSLLPWGRDDGLGRADFTFIR